MPIVIIRSDNFSGQTADVTFYPATGGTVNFNGVTIPYQYQTDYPYGTYSVHFIDSNNTCPYEIVETTPTPTTNCDFELLKLEIRLCVDMKILTIKKQAEISLLMDGIGKQITGWRNSQP